MTDVEKAWVGAMVQADGCVSKAKYWRINFVNTDVELIATILRLTGVGRVYYHKADGRFNYWEWSVFRKDDVDELARELSPFCEKARKVAV